MTKRAPVKTSKQIKATDLFLYKTDRRVQNHCFSEQLFAHYTMLHKTLKFLHALPRYKHSQASLGWSQPVSSRVYTYLVTKHYVRALERSAPSVYPVTLSQSIFCLVTGNARRNLLFFISIS